MKLLSIAVPCYNSAAYMRHCIDTLLTGGDQVEILIVDDGSTKDDTAAIADEYEARYPGICRAIHQENAGHGLSLIHISLRSLPPSSSQLRASRQREAPTPTP